jgi:hypothetical protein
VLNQDRQQNPMLHAVRTAGPTRGWLAVGAVAGAAIMLVLAFGLQIWSPLIAVLVAVVVFIGVGLKDRDAWIARCAIYQFGARQDERIKPGYPTGAAAAIRWIADPANASADDVTRAFVLMNAGRLDDALTTVDRGDGRTPTDEASAERLRLSIRRERGEIVDRSRFDAVTAALPVDERTWQRHALAAMFLVRDIADGVPWRDRYVYAVRDLGPWRLPRRAWFVIVTQQFAMAITFGFLFIVLLMFVGRS